MTILKKLLLSVTCVVVVTAGSYFVLGPDSLGTALMVSGMIAAGSFAVVVGGNKGTEVHEYREQWLYGKKSETNQDSSPLASNSRRSNIYPIRYDDDGNPIDDDK